MKKKKRLALILKIIVAMIFAYGVLVIALYKFDNRNLKLQIKTTNGDYVTDFYNYAIKQRECQTIVFEGTKEVEITQVKLFGGVKSIPLKSINYAEFIGYIANVPDGGAMVGERSLKIVGPENLQIIMTETFEDMLDKCSSSFLLERVILLELLGVVVALLLLMIKVYEEKYADNSWNNHGPLQEIQKVFVDIEKYWQYTVYAAKTDLKAEVANSYLNRLWWLLEPFFNMLVYVIVFGKIMGSSVENYATFVFSALLMWNFFSKTVNYSVKLVRNNKDIVTKVYIPKFIILISNMILNMYKFFFSFLVLIIMMLIFRVNVGIGILWAIPAYLLMILFAFGIGMIFLHFGVYVDDLSYAVGILLNMLMFLSGIFYDVLTTLTEPLNYIMLGINPVALFVDTMRNALLYNTISNVPLIIIWLIISLILCAVGVHIVYKNENSYVKVV